MRGKIVFTSDSKTGQENGFVENGTNGFILPGRSASPRSPPTNVVLMWVKLLNHVLAMNASTLRDFERRSFDIAERWTQEGVLDKFVTRVQHISTR